MHGQKKRRKRSLAGVVSVGGFDLAWSLLSEPQWTTEEGYKGLCIAVRLGVRERELILEYPFPKKVTGNGAPQIPQRPKFSPEMIARDVRKAIAAGWNPESCGKRVVFKLT